MFSPPPGHFLFGTGNAKLLWLLGGGSGNIIIWTVIIEGIKEESTTESLPKKQRHSGFKAGYLYSPVLWPQYEETYPGSGSGPLSMFQKNPPIYSWCFVPNKIRTSAPFYIFMRNPSVFVCIDPSTWCLYQLLLSGGDSREHKPDEGFALTFGYTICVLLRCPLA